MGTENREKLSLFFINLLLSNLGTLNAISFTSEHSGTQTIIGRGAGGIETASAILRDLIDIKKEITKA